MSVTHKRNPQGCQIITLQMYMLNNVLCASSFWITIFLCLGEETQDVIRRTIRTEIYEQSFKVVAVTCFSMLCLFVSVC